MINKIKQFKDKKILIIGDYCIDEILEGETNSISPEAPILRVNIERVKHNPGMTGNIAYGTRSLGPEVYVAGVIGNDDSSKKLLELFNKMNIDSNGMVFQHDRITPKFSRIYVGGKRYPQQSAIRFDFENENSVNKETSDKILEYISKKIKDIDAIIIADYDEVGKGVINPQFLEVIVNLAKENNKILIGDSRKNFWMFKNFTCITPNRIETELIHGKKVDNLKEMAYETIKKLNLDMILLKKDSEGMEIFSNNGESYKTPALAKKVIDVTGVGDNVTSALTLALCSDFNLYESIMIASYVAAIAVSKPGISTVNMDELNDFILENER